MFKYVGALSSANFYTQQYLAGEYHKTPAYGTFDYYTGQRTSCFSLSHLGVLDCWSRSIAARQLGCSRYIANSSKNGANVIITSDKSVWVIYDNDNEKLASLIKQVQDKPILIFELIYNSLPVKVKNRLAGLGYTTVENHRMILDGDESGFIISVR